MIRSHSKRAARQDGPQTVDKGPVSNGIFCCPVVLRGNMAKLHFEVENDNARGVKGF